MSIRAFNILCVLITVAIAAGGCFFPEKITPFVWIGVGVLSTGVLHAVTFLYRDPKNRYVWEMLAMLLALLALYVLYLIPLPVHLIEPLSNQSL